MTQPATPWQAPTRRAVVAAAGAAGLAATLAACGDDSGSDKGGQTVQDKPSDSGGSGGGGDTKPGAAGDGSGGGGGKALGRTSDIPQGGGKVFKDEKVVVTQPTSGTYKAFSAVCTHQGCTVAEVTDGTINCPCHGSKFRIADGSVANGPATKPLPGQQVTVKGDSIVLG